MTGFLASKPQYREYTGYQVKELNMILFFILPINTRTARDKLHIMLYHLKAFG